MGGSDARADLRGAKLRGRRPLREGRGACQDGREAGGPRNAGIADLGLAPRNGAGEVEFTAPVVILKPADLSRGNGRLLYDVVNRGRKLGLELLNDAPASNDPTSAAQAGNGFLMEQGYTVVWSGWQGDLATANTSSGCPCRRSRA
jgi:hypothetical protein